MMASMRSVFLKDATLVNQGLAQQHSSNEATRHSSKPSENHRAVCKNINYHMRHGNIYA
jgi:hypothetical protein